MKIFFISILLFVYAVASSGATVNFHYCMGKFTGIDLKSSAGNKCSNCGMTKEQKKGCCNDKHTTLRLKKDQLTSAINIVPANQFVYLQHQYPFLIALSLTNADYIIQSIHRPPLIPTIPSFLFNCIFRI